METQIIYSGGDVVLCNGTGGSAERFLVSTIFLKNASKVFTAMFSDRFAEGQQLSSANPPDVTLEQDNMLGVLLRMLHLRYKAVPHKLSREELQALAALADKYGCAHAVVPACSAWFAHFRSLPTQDNDHIFLTEAAFLLKYDVEFAFWTKQAILNMSEHFQARPESKLPIEVLRECREIITCVTSTYGGSYPRATAILRTSSPLQRSRKDADLSHLQWMRASICKLSSAQKRYPIRIEHRVHLYRLRCSP